MLLSDFLKRIDVIKTNCTGDERVINGVYNSKKVSENYVFFDFNNGAYISDAVERGASVVVSENFSSDYPCVTVKSVRQAFCCFCSELYSRPEEKLKFIGIVGTNGKTSTCKIINHILKSNGYKTANIGTLGAEIDGVTYSTDMTTPDTDVFYKLLDIAVMKKIDFVIMELSAHAIFFQKMDNIIFDYCVFTNATPDHIDFFKDLKRYYEVKKSVFTDEKVKCAVINADDGIGLEIAEKRKEKTVTYGINNPSDTFAIDIKYNTGINCIVNSCDYISELVTPLCGCFNLYNILAAVSVCVDIGMDINSVCVALSTIPLIEGRYNVLYGKTTVIIDYAHTPDGLENVLKTARETTGKKLYVVFGCGGNRDKLKRPIMGEIATRLADFAIITSDNPRNEVPEDIISEIEMGAKRNGDNYCTVADREKAISMAISIAELGDTVVIAGKGAEEYMEIGNEKIPFSDKKICEELLGR